MPAPPPAMPARETGARAPIGMVRNPRSHRNKGQDLAAALPEDLLVVEPANKQELEEALARFAEAGVSALVISGGDGTVRDVLTRGARHFAHGWPPLVLLPQGKTNALAINLALPDIWPLERALAALDRGSFAERCPLELECLDGERAGNRFYGFLVGAGVFNAAIDAGQAAHRRGAFQALAVALAGISGFIQALTGLGNSAWRKTFAITVTASDGNELPYGRHGQLGRRYLAGFTTLRAFPLGIRPFPGERPAESVDAFAIDAPLRRVVALMPLALFGRNTEVMRKLGLHRTTGSAFTIALDDPFILDGETFPAGRYRISAGPRLRFIVP